MARTHSIVWLFIAFEDGEIAQWEAWGLFLSYMLYVVVNAFWSRIMACSFVKNFSDSVGGGDLSLYVEGERQSKGEIMEHGNLTEELLVDNYINDLDKPDVDHRSVGDGGGGRSKSNASTGLVRSRYENDGSFSWQEDELTVPGQCPLHQQPIARLEEVEAHRIADDRLRVKKEDGANLGLCHLWVLGAGRTQVGERRSAISEGREHRPMRAPTVG